MAVVPEELPPYLLLGSRALRVTCLYGKPLKCSQAK
jgi:hypothetical protein